MYFLPNMSLPRAASPCGDCAAAAAQLMARNAIRKAVRFIRILVSLLPFI
jgi:hypothetical protein